VEYAHIQHSGSPDVYAPRRGPPPLRMEEHGRVGPHLVPQKWRVAQSYASVSLGQPVPFLIASG
jgi:hypothetical protein